MFLIIDKPKGWTSHDVVAKMRNRLGEKKIGHMGTLDPLATGVLVLAVGRDSTKKIVEYMKADKDYQVEMELGKTSDTYDSAGKIELVEFDLSRLSEAEIIKAIESFWGKSMQTPPAFSAKKIKGKRAYELARKGEKVELKPVEVFMQGSDIELSMPILRFKVTVSSGTYVRSLVHDIGKVLGCGAIMVNLRRTRVGNFRIEDAQDVMTDI